MANIALQPVSAATTITYSSANSGGDTITGLLGLVNPILKVRNASGSSVTVTLAGSQPCSQGSTHNVTATVGAGADQEIPIPGSCVSGTGTCGVTYSSATSVSVAATDYIA